MSQETFIERAEEEEAKEKATVLSYLAKASFPFDHLAPWMSIHDKRRLLLLAAAKNIANVGKELDRRVWLDGITLNANGEETEEKANEEPEFMPDRVRGAAGMFGYCLMDFATQLHDLAPSENGIGRRQAIGLGQAQKTGVATEPKKRSLLDKLLGKNKDRDKVGTGA